MSSLGGLREAYNAIYARAEFGERAAIYRKVLRWLQPEPGAAILDVGCGTGPFAEFAAGHGHPVVGVDLADNALAKARAKGLTKLALAQGERLPFADDSWGWAVCLGNLEHFLDPLAGVRELARVLAPGGRVAIMLPNAYYSGDLWKVVRTGRGPDHHQAIDRFATCAEWRDLLEAGGLAVQGVYRWDKGKWWKRLLPFNLAYHFVYVATPASGD